MLQRYFEAANRFIDEHRFSGVAVAFVFDLLVVAFCFTRAYEMFELKLYDLRFALRPSIQEWDRLCFLDIDENSLTTVGQFPWPRSIYGRGLETLKETGAFQASFDVMFPDSSPRILDAAGVESASDGAALPLATRGAGSPEGRASNSRVGVGDASGCP